MTSIEKAKMILDFYTKKRDTERQEKNKELDEWSAPFKTITRNSPYFYDYDNNAIHFSGITVQKIGQNYKIKYYGKTLGVKGKWAFNSFLMYITHSTRFELTEDEALEAIAEYMINYKSEKYVKV